ncbi:ester cyclase [Nonomuraea sp. NPDC000554]|uniref:ester cyclase n=1 Tax=Nonomuraea sp. NPDC000554 TaxID=3154259 RepID=UPI003328C0F7
MSANDRLPTLTPAITWLGIPASGQSMRMRSIDIWRVEDSLFAEHWDEVNVLEVFRHLGALKWCRPSDSSALRNTFNRMLGCLYHCLQKGVPYDGFVAFPTGRIVQTETSPADAPQFLP